MIVVRIATEADQKFAEDICKEMEESAKKRGTGIAKRAPEYLAQKMIHQNAIIALVDNKIAGFSYIEIYDDGEFITNSGLIVFPEFRNLGLAKKIKKEIFKLSRTKFKGAKIVSITTSSAVLKLNTELSFRPVTFEELPVSESFWKGCQSCVNYDVLSRNNRKMCLCTGLLYDKEKKSFIKILDKWRKK
ncbi:argininosuccinate synthase [Flavobacteriaceae bacterium UJ101]|nr:argininosuccinate synthase [Flavobacteriaceae bacterium UJ101]